jgi:hypothetical protein
MRPGEHRRERIEARGLTLEVGGARLERAGEVGVAAAPHLHEERVEAVLTGGAHERGDRVR